jgi:hypothetical protein
MHWLPHRPGLSDSLSAASNTVHPKHHDRGWQVSQASRRHLYQHTQSSAALLISTKAWHRYAQSQNTMAAAASLELLGRTA